jgi:hypothetical protein
MNTAIKRELQYLSLRTAASLAYMQLVGNAPNARDTLVLHRVLDDVAHALAIVSPLHAYDSSTGTLQTIDERALLAGRFVRGAAALIAPDGTEYQNLVMQRGDLESAVLILRETRLPKLLRAAHLRE